jgi:hypothetical protein
VHTLLRRKGFNLSRIQISKTIISFSASASVQRSLLAAVSRSPSNQQAYDTPFLRSIEEVCAVVVIDSSPRKTICRLKKQKRFWHLASAPLPDPPTWHAISATGHDIPINTKNIEVAFHCVLSV